MISQVNSVRFLVYTLLCVKSWSTDSWGVVPKQGECSGILGGAKNKNITVCNANANLPEAAKIQNSIFAPPNAAPWTVPPGANAPFCPLPAATEYMYITIALSRHFTRAQLIL